MSHLICPSCLHSNEVQSEKIAFCKNCHKKLTHNYTDWKYTKSAPSFSDYLNEFNQQNEEASKRTIFDEKEVKEKKKKVSNKDIIKLAASFIFIAFTFLCTWTWQQQVLNKQELTSADKTYYSDINWKNYSFGDSLSITLPFALRLSPTIISPYLSQYTHSIKSKRAESSQSFSVTIEEYELSNYFSTNHHEFYNLQDMYVLESNAEVIPLPQNEMMHMKHYNVDVAHNTFSANNSQYISDNYTLTKGNKGIKIIVSYLKNDKLLNKYADIVNESIYKNA